MVSVPFHYVDLRAFAYETEAEGRVDVALRTFLPDGAEIQYSENEGHYGDRITVLSTRLERADEIRHVMERVAAIDDPGTLLAELDERVDDNCSLYLTFDKQAAVEGTVSRGDGITLRAKVEAYPAKRANAVSNAREAIEAL